jgi:hypothetical protein
MIFFAGGVTVGTIVVGVGAGVGVGVESPPLPPQLINNIKRVSPRKEQNTDTIKRLKSSLTIAPSFHLFFYFRV